MTASATLSPPQDNAAPVRRELPVAIVLTVMLVMSATLALASGPVSLSLSQLWQTLVTPGQVPPAHALVIWELRLPRIVLGILAGAVLALSGATLQGLFRNPLADAGLLGVSSGAALGAVAFIVLADQLPVTWHAALGRHALPLAAFAGGLAVTFMAWRLAWQNGITSVATLLLAGIAINALAGAGTGLLTYAANDDELRSLSFWTMGSLAYATWEDIAIISPWLILGTMLLFPLARPLNAFLLGENVAGHLGYPVERIKMAMVITTALLVGTTVSMAGPVGFIGLLVPHIIRGITGTRHEWLLPLSALAGAVLMVSADTFCRWVVAPAELPIGLAMALLGSPFFLYMLQRHTHDHA